MALPRIRIGRALAYLAAIAISAFILAPIYLITISAFSSFDAVYEYPKNLVPSDLSMESMNIFLDSDGVTDSLQRSVYVAVLTIVACLAIGTPGRLRASRVSRFGRQSVPAGTREHARVPAHHHRRSRWP